MKTMSNSTLESSNATTLLLLLLGVALSFLTAPVSAGDDYETLQVALAATSSQCQIEVARCLQGWPGVQQLYKQGRYCDMMDYEDNMRDMESCAVGLDDCTQQEFDALEWAVCEGTSLAVSLAADVILVLAGLLGKYV